MPFHKNRRWAIVEVATAEELAEKLTEHDWTACTGFEHGGYLFLNDSTSADGAQEYAVVRRSDLRQIESITFGWCTRLEALHYIQRTVAGEFTEELGSVAPERLETPAAHGTCGRCA